MNINIKKEVLSNLKRLKNLMKKYDINSFEFFGIIYEVIQNIKSYNMATNSSIDYLIFDIFHDYENIHNLYFSAIEKIVNDMSRKREEIIENYDFGINKNYLRIVNSIYGYIYQHQGNWGINFRKNKDLAFSFLKDINLDYYDILRELKNHQKIKYYRGAKNIGGFLYEDPINDKREIYINRNQHKLLQEVSLIHEFGHYLNYYNLPLEQEIYKNEMIDNEVPSYALEILFLRFLKNNIKKEEYYELYNILVKHLINIGVSENIYQMFDKDKKENEREYSNWIGVTGAIKLNDGNEEESLNNIIDYINFNSLNNIEKLERLTSKNEKFANSKLLVKHLNLMYK